MLKLLSLNEQTEFLWQRKFAKFLVIFFTLGLLVFIPKAVLANQLAGFESLPTTLPPGLYKLTVNFLPPGSTRIIYSDNIIFQANNDQKECHGKCFITLPSNLPSNLTRATYLTKLGSNQPLAFQIDRVRIDNGSTGPKLEITPLCDSSDPNCSTAAGDATGCKENEIKTTAGCVPTPPNNLLTTIFRAGLEVAGGIALLLMIYSAVKMILSKGNKGQLKSAQDQFSSAFIGLLFVVFSLLLLQLIGVNVLNIPGFS
jgi:hypothetical protein